MYVLIFCVLATHTSVTATLTEVSIFILVLITLLTAPYVVLTSRYQVIYIVTATLTEYLRLGISPARTSSFNTLLP
jgi:hypothetical protein